MQGRQRQIRNGATLAIVLMLGAACGTASSDEQVGPATSIDTDSSPDPVGVESSTTTAQPTESMPSDPVLDGPTIPMAVVGVSPGEQVPFYANASTDEEAAGSIPGSSIFVDVLVDEDATSSGSVRRYVKRVDRRPVDGWVDASFLREIEGDSVQSEDVLEVASSFRRALSLDHAGFAMAELVVKARVSADSVFTDDDPVIEGWQLSDEGLGTIFNWGPDVGRSAGSASTINEFLERLSASRAIQETEHVSINTRVLPAEAQDNIAEFFPEGTVIELFSSGDGQDADGNDVHVWESVILVFEIHDLSHLLLPDQFALSGLALDGGISPK